MEGSFESLQDQLNNNSIFDYPDRFAEALPYVFEVGREPILTDQRKAGQVVASPE